MIEIKKLESASAVSGMKQRYIEQATAPLDGMWFCGFVPMSMHFGFFQGDELIGYFCVNDENYLLQFFVRSQEQAQSSELFESIFQDDTPLTSQINGAFVSTAEPRYLSLCLDRFSKFEVNALMYQRDASVVLTKPDSEKLTAVQSEQLSEAIDFAVSSIGAPEEWLHGYYSNLISRQELFGIWKNNQLIATGESRGYDEYQKGYADVGMIVAPSERGRGLATSILWQLVSMNEQNGLQSICSTTQENLAAQTAIERAGFFASNRIIQFKT